ELMLKRGNAEPKSIQLEFGESGLNLPLSGRLVSEEIGYIELPQFGASLTDMKRMAEESRQYAERGQTLIRELDQKNLRGWMIDLRLNNGGNMWPMLAGIGPILGEGDVGSFVSAGGSAPWSYRDGKALNNNNIQAQVATPYKVKNGNLPIAILTDAI